MAFFKVLVMDCCPTTESKVVGRYLRAETTKFSIAVIDAAQRYTFLIRSKVFFFNNEDVDQTKEY